MMPEGLSLAAFVEWYREPPFPASTLRSTITATLEHILYRMGILTHARSQHAASPPMLRVVFQEEASFLMVAVAYPRDISSELRAELESLPVKMAIIGVISEAATRHHWSPVYVLHGSPQHLVEAMLAPSHPRRSTRGEATRG